MNKPYEFRGNAYRYKEELEAWAKLREEPALEPDLPIIDPHHHLWEDEHRGRFLVQELAAEVDSGHNIVATVYIECGSMFRADGLSRSRRRCPRSPSGRGRPGWWRAPRG